MLASSLLVPHFRRCTLVRSMTIKITSRNNEVRPTLDDVDRLSRGKPSKQKIGSRNVPHRLNAEERTAFDIAKKRGYLVVKTNSRSYPLINTFCNLCDALGHPNIRIEQEKTGNDKVIVDLSTMRLSQEDEMTLKGRVASVLSEFNVQPSESTIKSDVDESVLSLFSDDDLESMQSDSLLVTSILCDRQTSKSLVKELFDCCLELKKSFPG